MTKKEALSIVFACADAYQENLVDRMLLLVTTDKQKRVLCTEVSFDASNYLHLTGFKLTHGNMSANNFYDLCLDRRLTERDFEFAADGTTILKMRVLPGVMKKNLSARMLGDYNGLGPRLYTDKIAGSTGACIGFIASGRRGRYVPNTMLEGDVRSLTKSADRIVAIYRKRKGDERYVEIVYVAKKVDWSKISLPEEYSYLSLPQNDCEKR